MTIWKGGRSLEVLTLALQGEIFALEVAHVREILDLVPITEVPRQPAVPERPDQCARQGHAAGRSAAEIWHGADAADD